MHLATSIKGRTGRSPKVGRREWRRRWLTAASAGFRAWLLCSGLFLGVPTVGWAQLTSSQVLVVYNSLGPSTTAMGMSDSQAIYEYYRQIYPEVRGLDLNDAQLTAGNISYADFESHIRDPLRTYLTEQGLASQISVITLTKDLPHRILDANQGAAGDSPAAAGNLFDASNLTYAAVDSELTLLWQDLLQGEANGSFDSHADMVVANPYHNRRDSMTAYDRSQITSPLRFRDFGQQNSAWQLARGTSTSSTAVTGSIYLTSRLDGSSVPDVWRMIDRGRAAAFRSDTDAIILDESPPGTLDEFGLFNGTALGDLGADYNDTASQLGPEYPRLIFDQGSDFLTGTGDSYTGTAPRQIVTGNVAVLASYGGNHDRGTDAPTNTGFVESFAGQLVDGAIMNTIESYNGRPLGGLPSFSDQGDVVQWVDAGGSFGIGNVWEPFAFSVPDNEVLLDEMTQGNLTWVEAAWSSTPWLSWQQVVVGDPLARGMTISGQPAEAVWNGGGSPTSPSISPIDWTDASRWTRNGVAGVAAQQGDHVFLKGTVGSPALVSNDRWIIESIHATGPVVVEAPLVAVRSGDIQVDTGGHLTIRGDLLNGRGLTLRGGGILDVHGITGAIDVQQGTLTGTGMRTAIQVEPNAQLLVKDELTVRESLDVKPLAQITWQPSSASATPLVTVWGSASVSGSAVLYLDRLNDDLSNPGERVSVPLLRAFDGAVVLPGNVTVINTVTDSEVRVPTDGTPTHIGAGIFSSLTRSPQGLLLSAIQAFDGDADGDQDIDSLDLLNLLGGWTGVDNSTGAPADWELGDFDSDLDVDSQDLLDLLGNWTGFGQGVPPGSAITLTSTSLSSADRMSTRSMAAGLATASSAAHAQSLATTAVSVPEPHLGWMSGVAAVVSMLRTRRRSRHQG